MTHRWQ